VQLTLSLIPQVQIVFGDIANFLAIVAEITLGGTAEMSVMAAKQTKSLHFCSP